MAYRRGYGRPMAYRSRRGSWGYRSRGPAMRRRSFAGYGRFRSGYGGGYRRGYSPRRRYTFGGRR